MSGDAGARPELLVITGPPGSGKSTVCQLVAQHFGRCALVQGDVFFGFVVRGYIDPWLPESHPQNIVVTEATATAVGRFVKGGFMTVFDGMVGPWFLPTFFQYCELEQFGYAVLLPTIDDCIERVQTRQGHGFRDEAVTRQMHEAFAKAQLDSRHVLHDVPSSPSAVADEVLRRFDRGLLTLQRPEAAKTRASS